MNIVALQYDIAWESREANFDTVRRLLTKSAVSPGSLIVLPEMFSTGFSMDVPKLAEGKKSETEKFLSSLAWQYESHACFSRVRIFLFDSRLCISPPPAR